MIQFVQPIWLLAIAGITVPVIIHLWNVKQGKTLKVGSIAFLTESARAHSKSLKLSELLLLLLRCLLLIVIALLLCKPFWERQADLAGEKGWILIERKSVKEAYNKFQPAIDSLLKSGYSFHYFNQGFKEVQFEDALRLELASVKETSVPYWLLLKDLNQQVPAELPLYLFTDNSLRRFKGSRPNVAVNLTWNTYASADTVSTWLEKAYETTTDSTRVVIANSNPNGTYYTYQNISNQPSNAKFNVSVEHGKTIVTYRDTSAQSANNTVEVDTSALAIFIYTDRFGPDANYLRAALNAIKDFTKQKIKTVVVGNVGSIPSKYDWLFWLSENAVPAGLVKSNLFVYGKGKVFNVHSRVLTGDIDDTAFDEPLNMYKMIENNGLDGSYPIWKNGYGETLLSKEKSRSVYHFYSRFNPQWNDLTWSNQFPQIIYNLIYDAKNGTEATISASDKRAVDEIQIQPTIVDEGELFPKESLLRKIDLTKTFWIVAFILFLAERIVSYRSKKRELYGSV